jgi:hypothetical protein
MSFPGLLEVLTCLTLSLAAPHADVRAEPVRDTTVRASMWTLLADARYGFAKSEQAAFLVRHGDSYFLVRWPESTLRGKAHWSGAFPPHAVAIVHTHPNWTPDPSALDAQTARVTGLPVYVITRQRISKTIGDATIVVASGEWKSSVTAVARRSRSMRHS